MEKPQVILGKISFYLLFAGAVMLIAGFIMMGNRTGSSSHDMYSFTKITLSPLFILAGYGLLILSIFKK